MRFAGIILFIFIYALVLKELNIFIKRSYDTKLRYGNLMLTSQDTYLPAKNLIRMFYIFIFICEGKMPPHL